ncbi:MAG: adenylate/guanylate cyclase domain-containing protein [Phycisphaerae bacterium]|nr:adenylate/guanylate cyclase domain-containing protein [Phycisphaerae bacterium]
MSEEKSNNAKRTLAAIVFTDIVDYSAHMQKNEDKTLRLAKRDLDAIREICNQCEGRVLKFTGDGLLMYFESATQAVACAMRSQAHFAAVAKKVPPEEQLQHRIGIHLGDVFVSEDDVMGDGVNVAARLQAEAPPGGICVSQTVYDVVKNRLGVKVTYLGPRELKNIREAVPVYQILLDAAGFGEKPIRGDKQGAGWKWILAGALGAVVMAGGIIATWMATRTSDKPDSPPRIADAPTTAPSPVTAMGSDTQPTDQPRRRLRGLRSARPPVDDTQRQAVDDARRRFLPAGDFQGFVEWLEQNNLADSPLAKQYRQAAQLKKMAKIRLMSSSAAEPIDLEIPTPRGPRRAQLWAGENGDYHLRTDAGRERTLRQIPARMLLGLYEAVAVSPDQRRTVGFLLSEYRRLGPE